MFSLDGLSEQVTSTPLAPSAGDARAARRTARSRTGVVDELEAILEESGEILHAIESGAITSDALVELGAAPTDAVERTQRTVFKSVGVAVQDWAIARLLADEFLT